MGIKMNFKKTKLASKVSSAFAAKKNLVNPSAQDLATAKPFYEKLVEMKEGEL